jgi:hypothetical protein
LRGAAGTASDTDRGATLVGCGALGTASDTDRGYNLVGGSALGSDISAASRIDTASLGGLDGGEALCVKPLRKSRDDL